MQYLFEVWIGVAGLIAPVNGNTEQLVRSLECSQLCSHVDISAVGDILKYDRAYTSRLRAAGR